MLFPSISTWNILHVCDSATEYLDDQTPATPARLDGWNIFEFAVAGHAGQR